MNYQNRPFPAGLDMQGRYTTRHASAEDASGMCDTGPGELSAPELEIPESVFQAEPEPEPTPWRALGFMFAVAFGSIACLHVLVPQ